MPVSGSYIDPTPLNLRSESGGQSEGGRQSAQPDGMTLSTCAAGSGVDKFVTNVLYCPDTRPVGYRPLGDGVGYVSGGLARHDSEPNEC